MPPVIMPVSRQPYVHHMLVMIALVITLTVITSENSFAVDNSSNTEPGTVSTESIATAPEDATAIQNTNNDNPSPQPEPAPVQEQAPAPQIDYPAGTNPPEMTNSAPSDQGNNADGSAQTENP